jgi:transcriptional regulator with XRE-family HTH domain
MRAMAKKSESFTDQLRAAVEHSGKTRYRIAKETGVSQETLSRFANGKRTGMSMEAIDKLFQNLGLRISKR